MTVMRTTGKNMNRFIGQTQPNFPSVSPSLWGKPISTALARTITPSVSTEGDSDAQDVKSLTALCSTIDK